MALSPASMNSSITSAPRDRREDAIRGLEYYEGEYPLDGIENGVTLLLNEVGALPEQERGFLDFGPRLAVTRVVLRMLRQLPDAAAVERAVVAILPQLTSLSSEADLIETVGHTENVGHTLIGESKFSELMDDLYSKVRTTNAADLANEWDLLRLLLKTKRHAEARAIAYQVPNEIGLNAALLRSSYTEVLGQGLGSRAVQRSPRLHWNVLSELWSPEAMSQRITELKSAFGADLEQLLDLAEKYLNGWNPNHNDE